MERTKTFHFGRIAKSIAAAAVAVVIITSAALPAALGAEANDTAGFVTRLYRVSLGREPEEYGFNAWVERLTSGEWTGAEVAHGFFFSEEMTAKNLSNSDFIETLYGAMLGRPADPDGKAVWSGMLESGSSREDIFTGFADSAEFYSLCLQYGIDSGSNYTPSEAAPPQTPEPAPAPEPEPEPAPAPEPEPEPAPAPEQPSGPALHPESYEEIMQPDPDSPWGSPETPYGLLVLRPPSDFSGYTLKKIINTWTRGAKEDAFSLVFVSGDFTYDSILEDWLAGETPTGWGTNAPWQVWDFYLEDASGNEIIYRIEHTMGTLG